MAIGRAEHGMASTAHEPDQELQTLGERQHAVIEHLRAAGFLQQHQHTNHV
ncbi:MAG TPA: hypothetical protein VEJ23_06415 [Solirubrobacteraceae bacterium]|nr:hypothetical protein [Solirubrobacteraceae bacterium]